MITESLRREAVRLGFMNRNFWRISFAAYCLLAGFGLLAYAQETPDSRLEAIPEKDSIGCQSIYRPFSTNSDYFHHSNAAKQLFFDLEEFTSKGKWGLARSLVTSAFEKTDRPISENKSLHQTLHESTLRWPVKEFRSLISYMELSALSLMGAGNKGKSDDRLERGFAFLQTKVGLEVYLRELAVLHDSTRRNIQHLSYRYKLLKLRRGFPIAIKPETLVRAMYVHGFAGDYEAVEEFADAAVQANDGNNLITVNTKRNIEIEEHRIRMLKVARNQQFVCKELDVGSIGEVLAKHGNQFVVQQRNFQLSGVREPIADATSLWRLGIDGSSGQLAWEKPVLLSSYDLFLKDDFSFSWQGEIGFVSDSRVESMSFVGKQDLESSNHFYGKLAGKVAYLGSKAGKHFGYYTDVRGYKAFISELSAPNDSLVTFKPTRLGVMLEELVEPLGQEGCFITRVNTPFGFDAEPIHSTFKHYKFGDDNHIELISEISFPGTPRGVHGYYNSKQHVLLVREADDYSDDKFDRIRAFKFGGCESGVKEIEVPGGLKLGQRAEFYFSDSGEYLVIAPYYNGASWLRYLPDDNKFVLLRAFEKSTASAVARRDGDLPYNLSSLPQLVMSEKGDAVSYVNERDEVEIAFEVENGPTEVVSLGLLPRKDRQYLMPIAFVGDEVLLVASYQIPNILGTDCKGSCGNNRIYADHTYAVYLPNFLSGR